MISESQKELARWALSQCLKLGCQAARVNIYAGTNTDFEVRDRQLDKLMQSSEKQLVFQLYLDERFGSFSTNRMDKTELGDFIDEAVESVRYLAPDPCRQLPNPSRYYKGGLPDLNLYDATINEHSPDEKLQLAHRAAEEILGTDSRILSVQTAYSDGESFSYTVDSNGFEGESAHSYFSLTVSVAVQGAGDAKPEAYWYDQALFWKDLKKEGIGKEALKRALQKLGQSKVASGKYTMLVDNMNVGRLLGPILSALNGGALQQKNSFLMDKLGQRVLSEKISMYDNPHATGTFGARYFDHEGVATQKRFVVEKGVLNTYFFDTYNGLKMGVEPTISNLSQLVFEHGDRSMEELLKEVDKGILVTGFNGGNCNSSSGDFSFGIEGFLIENGQCTQPVSEMNITGNMLTLWDNVLAVGNDPRTNNAYQIPSMLFVDVDFSGM